ncbi:MAG: diaminopropionate ammonia-lyase [Myxococcales bacterium]|nr:MAG: diaminopropionate ammonia-lyase [Myxococcales bacterium]
MAELIFPPVTSFYDNPKANPALEYDSDKQSVISLKAYEQASQEICSWPGYQPTPLRNLDGLAASLGVKHVLYKDEGSRFALGSFKALGGAYAVYKLLAEQVAKHDGGLKPSAQQITQGKHRSLVSGITVCSATDGNHGRSVAWGAKIFGCRCVIYIHEHVSKGREAAIAAYGAKVVRHPGNYDDAVKQAAADAKKNGWFIVSDTSYEGYTQIPKDVMQGYTIMVQEALDQLPAGVFPTHVFVQGGVGAMAASVCAHLWQRYGQKRPRFIVVEPDKADCLIQSAKAGKPTAVHGALDTIMAGLACGEISSLAWQILETGTDAFISIADEGAAQAMRLLATGVGKDRPLVAGESAVAGVAALCSAAQQPELLRHLKLDSDSCVLFFGTEGDTDPELYKHIVGRSGDEIRQSEVDATD